MQVSRRGFLKASLGGAAVLPTLTGAAPVPAEFQGTGAAAAGSMEPHYLSIAEAADRIRRKQLSPLELTEAILKRIDQLEPKLRAFITVARDQALEAARAAEKEIMNGRYRGPMHGIPVGVKDTHYTRGIKTTAGSPVLGDFIPAFDATVVARLKQAGAILIGKTNLPEFSMGGATPSANPWDLSRTPGGSSGGSAVALAAGLLTGATGGDTSNSIRHPSTLCNVVGMKPTYGRVSRYGVVAISWSLDHVGPMTRTVHDNALMLNVLAGHDPLDETTSEAPVPDYTRALKGGVRGMRIGIPRSSLVEDFHPDCRRALAEALEVFKKMGATVFDVEMPPTLDAMDEGHRIIRFSEAASYHEGFLARQADQYGRDSAGGGFRPRIDAESGSLVTAVQYLRALKLRTVFIKQLDALFRTFDLFIAPGRPGPAGEQVRVKQDFARMFNVSGFPCLALPAGFSNSPPGLPVGLQIAARPFQEETIYRAAAAYEAQTRWDLKRPNL
ncbi:MAG: aspartyl/glutamyl-tRNA amidotransferase subunit A [Acidobacteria bacterium]|nr:aspartyl/glutamyl-tRNA amidotransferase subunit A [Acidobacteriota bacterium]